MKVIQYWEPIGDSSKIQDGVPDNYLELEKIANRLPKNFGCVHSRFYRGGMVYSTQIPFLIEKRIGHIISLLDGNWLENGLIKLPDYITQHKFPILQRRELTAERILKILDVIWTIEEQSDDGIYLHCLKGAVRTSMVVAMHKILKGEKGNFGACFESLFYGNFNPSALREMMRYPS